MAPREKRDPSREFQTISGIPLKPVYTEQDLRKNGWDYEES